MMENFDKKKMIAFDVDGTLSMSRMPIDQEMTDLLIKLLTIKRVAIITGGAFSDIKRQILDKIGVTNELNTNLTLLPTNGGGLCIFNNEWTEKDSHKLTDQEREKIKKAIHEVVRDVENPSDYGDKIQDRGSEITYSALGEHAPLELKHAWDPDFKKRITLQKALEIKLPEFEVKIGGTTSIDITQKGMDKAYGIKKLMEYYSYTKSDLLFFGDAVYENGNDYPVFLMGVDTIKVTGPEETKERLSRLLNNR